jgi:hypothetical protein
MVSLTGLLGMHTETLQLISSARVVSCVARVLLCERESAAALAVATVTGQGCSG